LNVLIQRMIRAARLEPALYEEVEHDGTATMQALFVVLLSSVAAGIGNLGLGGVNGLFGGLVASVVGWVVWSGVIYVLGTKVLPETATEADLGQLLRTLGFASSPGLIRVLGSIPVLGWLVSLVAFFWMLAATVVAVRQALDYTSTARAVLVCVLGWLAMIAVTVVIGMLFGGMPNLSGAAN
jgi:hypothetical protein